MNDENLGKILGDGVIGMEIECAEKKYLRNMHNYKKYIDALDIISDFVIKYDGVYIENPMVIPSHGNGYISVAFDLFDVCGAEKNKFAELVLKADVCAMNARTDGKVQFDITVNDVFVKERDNE